MIYKFQIHRFISIDFKCILLISFLVFSTLDIQANPVSVQKVKVQYFSKALHMEYDPAMLKKNKYCTSQACIQKFYTKLDETNYEILLNKLLENRERLQLNDWFFYTLVQKTIDEIYPKKTSMYKTNVVWFFMTKAGYDTRLYTAQNKYSFLYLKTIDDVYEMPFVKVNGDFYLDVTSVYYKLKTKGMLMEMQKFQPGALNKKLFSLRIKNYPSIPPMTTNKKYTFTHDQKEVTLNLKVDTIANQLLSNYPFVKAINYIETPFTETTKKSFLKAINPHIKNLELEDQLSFFVSFSRKAFDYEDDYEIHNRDQPLTAEQTLVSEFSDYEDRVSLMYQIMKEATDLNFVLIQYPDEDIITVGVQLPEVFGKPFIHEGVNYTICDPTMPTNTGKLGLAPMNIMDDFEILRELNQQIQVGMRE